MSAEPPFDPASAGWEQLLRSMLGPAADDVIAQLREGGFDPSQLPTIPGMPTDPEALRQMAA